MPTTQQKNKQTNINLRGAGSAGTPVIPALGMLGQTESWRPVWAAQTDPLSHLHPIPLKPQPKLYWTGPVLRSQFLRKLRRESPLVPKVQHVVSLPSLCNITLQNTLANNSNGHSREDTQTSREWKGAQCRP